MNQLSKSDVKWFDLALKIAEESRCKDRHGTVIVKAGCVISLATNRFTISHPVSARYLKKSLHSEQRAILKTKDCQGAVIYTARLHRENSKSYPCVMCLKLISDAGIKRIVYHDGVKCLTKRL